jgi:hypothetical protein
MRSGAGGQDAAFTGCPPSTALLARRATVPRRERARQGLKLLGARTAQEAAGPTLPRLARQRWPLQQPQRV